ncbi:MAG: hypothetical protein Q4C47_03570 [Planctomycetia bacterium]|nr:hypothetical protein [Planctomycetia bacterium]
MRNSGNVTVEQLQVQATIPSQLEVRDVSVDPGEVVNRSGHCDWTLPKLDPYGRATMTIVGMPRSAESFSISVRATVPPVENTTAIEVLEPKLSLAIQGPPKMLADHSEVFRLVLQNTGTGDAEDVRIVLTTLANGQDREVTVPHPIGTIPPGEPQQLDMRMTARRAGPLQVKVVAQNDSLGALAEASTSIEVCKPEITVALEGPGLQYVGGSVNYRFAIRNSGTAIAQNVVVRATLPETARWKSERSEITLTAQDRQLAWTLASLDPGEEQICVVGVEAMSSGACVAEVEATADGDLRTTTQLPGTIEAVALLSLNVEEPGRPVFIENEAIYTLTIRNAGSAATNQVGVIGEFGNGVVPVSAEGGVFRTQGTRVLFEPISSIAPGETLTIRVHTRARGSGNRMWKFEVSSTDDGIQVARQGTTRFYGDAGTASPSSPPPSSLRPESSPGNSVSPDSVPVNTSPAPVIPVPGSYTGEKRPSPSPSDGMVPLPGLNEPTSETARQPQTQEPTSNHRFFG